MSRRGADHRQRRRGVSPLIAVVGPLLWVVRVALRPQVSFLRDPAGIGGGWTLHNLADAWSIGGLGHALWNSTLVVVPGAALATALAATGRLGSRRLPLSRTERDPPG